MISYQTVESAYVYNILLLVGVQAVGVTQRDGKFSISSIMDAALPVIHPLVAAGSNKCEALKSFLGITYEQMQVKNSTNFQELSIDSITQLGSRKYNLSASRYMKQIMRNATNIVILIHGFMESSDGLMVQALAPELMKKPGLKLFALDGRKIINLEYFRSSTYARFMGERLGTFLSEVIKDDQDPSKITLIGHSLGSHIAAIAGKTVHHLTGQLVGRIIALDPAGPCFSNVYPSARIDKRDAAYVDVIHTNGGMLGLKEPVGHKDFYPNGGSSQPGCYLSTCDHSRAWEVLTETVSSPKNFPARKCENWTMFTNGLCSKNEISFMGMISEEGSEGVYFLSTGSAAPFGLGPAGSG